jgi:hypothetical protein
MGNRYYWPYELVFFFRLAGSKHSQHLRMQPNDSWEEMLRANRGKVVRASNGAEQGRKRKKSVNTW